MNIVVENETELSLAAKKIIDFAGNRKVWLFNGQMGAGKTTLIKEICKMLNVNSELSSPTFSIVNEYKTKDGNKIFHFDLYRLKNERELADIGFEEYLYSNYHCFIEWPEIGNHFYPADSIHVNIHIDDKSRIISVE